MNRRNLRRLLASYGFTEYETPGFLGFSRGQDDLRVFFWSNAKVADKTQSPRSTTIFCVGFDGGTDQHRLVLSNVEWPSDEQRKRDWADIESELRSVILPLFEMETADAHDRARELGEGDYAFRRTPPTS